MSCRNRRIPAEFQSKLYHLSVFTKLTSPSETCEVGCIRRLEVRRTKSPQHCELPLVRLPALEQRWWLRCPGDRVPCIAQLPDCCSVRVSGSPRLQTSPSSSSCPHTSLTSHHHPQVSCFTQQLSALGGAHSLPALVCPKLIYSVLAGNSRRPFWFPLWRFHFSVSSLIL